MTTDEYRSKDFPIHHDMGEEGPVLDLGEIAEAIEGEGCMLVDVVRGEDGQLRIKTICMRGPEAEMDEDEPADLDEALTRTANEADDGDEVEDDD